VPWLREILAVGILRTVLVQTFTLVRDGQGAGALGDLTNQIPPERDNYAY
jgi:hypothetical protein